LRSPSHSRLDPIADRAALERLKAGLDHGTLAPVYETIREVKAKITPNVALLGFCGARQYGRTIAPN
jgi:uroporphyrinogen-III decarboxylase